MTGHRRPQRRAWTLTPPKEPGYYWICRPGDERAFPAMKGREYQHLWYAQLFIEPRLIHERDLVSAGTKFWPTAIRPPEEPCDRDG